eukprot:2437449-Prymnesium_polylepis.1
MPRLLLACRGCPPAAEYIARRASARRTPASCSATLALLCPSLADKHKDSVRHRLRVRGQDLRAGRAGAPEGRPAA